jgi:hypothetical protein
MNLLDESSDIIFTQLIKIIVPVCLRVPILTHFTRVDSSEIAHEHIEPLLMRLI